METCEQPIGIFDSGVGGLTVAQAVQKKLPNESVIYFGDRARCPYGDLAPEAVLQYATEISQFLLAQSVKCIVIACNTATAVALPALRELFSVPIIGVIEPGAAAAVAASKNGRIGVIGTSVTIASHAYRTAIHRLSPEWTVIEEACPEFVPLVERGSFEGPLVDQTVRASLVPFAESNIDTLVLGCTHYPLLSGVIRRVMGPRVTVISSADATALAVAQMLRENELECAGAKRAEYHYFTTGDGSKMRLALANWFASPAASEDVVQVQLPLLAESVLAHAVAH